MHVHVLCASGEAKFWLEPDLELARNFGLSRAELKQCEQIIEKHHHEFIAAWYKHFNG